MTSPPNTTGWNFARSNFTNFVQVNSSTPTTAIPVEGTSSGEMQVSVSLERSPRDMYYSTNYSPQTGFRIATTLGSFFLFVLLTLLYKSKCKKHSSRCATPLLPGPIFPPTTVTATTNTNSPTAPTDFHHHQVHPYASNFSYCPSPLPHPALLLTSANSDSSDEDLVSSTKPLCSNRFLQSGSSGHRQSIDIHVILPTPTVSPSSSEHFRTDPVPIPINHHHQHNYLSDRRRSSASSSTTTGTGTPFTGSPFTFPDNLKYVDDTSSENIPEVRSEEEEDEGGSLGSDSVFTCCEPPPPPLPPKRRPSNSPSYYSGLEEEWRVTLTQAHAQVHHRDSFASDLESVNDYLEGNESGAGSGTNSRRRSSSTQTTLSDLQHCLGLATCANVLRSPSPRLSPHPHPHHFMSLRQSPVQFLAAPFPGAGGNGGSGTAGSPRVKGGRKRSVDALLLARRDQHQMQGNRFICNSSTATPLTDKRNFGLVVEPDK